MYKFKFKDRTSLLDWCKENLTRDEKRFVVKTKNGNNFKFNKAPIPIYAFHADGQFICRFDSMLALEKEMGIARQAIRYCISRNSIYENKFYFSTKNEFAPTLLKRKKADYTGWNNKKVYVFNIEGLLVMEHESVVAAASWLNVPKHYVYRAIERENLFHATYYFSYNKDFKRPPAGKYNRNPLLRKPANDLQYAD